MNRLYRVLCSLSIAVIFWIGYSVSAFAQTPLNSPSKAENYLSQAIEQIQQQHYSQALQALNQAINLDNTLVEAYRDRCLISVQLGNYSQAIQDCLYATQLQPHSNSNNTYLNLGIAYYRSGDFTHAIAAYDHLIEHQADAVLGYYNRGLAYSELQDYTNAIADYNQALNYTASLEASQLAEIYIDRGIAYLMLDQIPYAIANFSTAIHHDASNPRAHYNHACACSRQGNTHTALQEFTATLHLNPNHALAHFNRAMLRQQQGLYAGAIADLKAACQCFTNQGNLAASRHTLALMEKLQQWLLSTEIQTIA
ncbi:tetratricopeptide repeat protein [Lyngbya sp. PCC 8106]|uniref:tetratricopeptide repeat protein n=1 Tax=Lyngbya sp. (strain PCC 8106) TaxID=313612 RepID=UPI0000EAD145|nr:tetratricopeptide repeat protein [Lyngbya sp. PCC 8106]EAW38235.1 TPR repeat protein [Lyngbya sp. PCC 8106]